jgi:hypothetical protein
MTDSDVPVWVEFTTRLKAVSETYGPDNETGWLLATSATMIAQYELLLARWYELAKPQEETASGA